MAPASSESYWAQTLYHSKPYRMLYAAFCLLNMALSIFEPPTSIYSSPGGLLAVRVLDYIFLGTVLLDLYIQRLYHGLGEAASQGWIRTKAVLVLAILINLTVHLCAPGVPYIMRAFRPIFFIERHQNVRRVAMNMLIALPKIVNIAALLVL